MDGAQQVRMPNGKIFKVVSIPQAVWTARNPGKIEKSVMDELGFNTASGMDGAQHVKHLVLLLCACVSIPQAVWTARNQELLDHPLVKEAVSIPQAVWTARNDFKELLLKVNRGCFNTASGMDGAQLGLLVIPHPAFGVSIPQAVWTARNL